MLRITTLRGHDGVTRLQLEGRLVEQTVPQLRAACDGSIQGGGLLLDLTGVRFADPAGVQELRDLERRGTALSGCSGFLRELLKPGAGDADPEAALLTRLRAGEDAAFESLVRQHGGRMLAVARRLLGSEDDARDAVQEAFVSAFKAIGSFAGNAKLSTWLHRIVVNTALMKLRSRRRRSEEPIEELLPRFDEQGEWVEAVGGFETPADVLVQRAETRALVRAMVDRLPEAYRTVLLLRDIEELDTEETAAILEMTPAAVKTRLHRARQALRTLLERALGEGPGRRAAG
jgi:RNA polymerase sigma-70 factor (ECF subfamily)